MTGHKKGFIAAVLSILLSAFCLSLSAQKQDNNLPDVLTLVNGKKVTTSKQWLTKRRPEILALFKKEMYGQSPGKPQNITFKVFDADKNALSGKATRKQVTVYFNGKTDGPQMDILLYIPNNARYPVPAIVGLNFDGNQSVSIDPAIKLSASWFDKTKGVVNNRATDATRGVDASQWPLETIIDRGYAVATVTAAILRPTIWII
jgi:hypothetical protein